MVFRDAGNLAPADNKLVNSLHMHSYAETRARRSANRDDGRRSVGFLRAVNFRSHQYGIPIGIEIWQWHWAEIRIEFHTPLATPEGFYWCGANGQPGDLA